MSTESRGATTYFLALLAGIAPILVAANDMTNAIILALAFIAIFTTAGTIPLVLPKRFTKSTVVLVTGLSSALTLSFCAFIVRLIDPMQFELVFRRLFLMPFILPVISASRTLERESDRDRAIEDIFKGIALALLIVLSGFMRELLATGSVSIVAEASGVTRFLLPVMAQPAGAFILLGLGTALAGAAIKKIKRSSV